MVVVAALEGATRVIRLRPALHESSVINEVPVEREAEPSVGADIEILEPGPSVMESVVSVVVADARVAPEPVMVTPTLPTLIFTPEESLTSL